METMIERVARAMCKEVEERATANAGQRAYIILGFPSVEAWVDACWPNYASQARVAIEAMRVSLFDLEGGPLAETHDPSEIGAGIGIAQRDVARFFAEALGVPY